MNRKKKNISLIVGENKASHRDKGRNLSQTAGKTNSYLENQKSMIVRNSEKTIKFAKTFKLQNKSFDIQQKSFDATDKRNEFNPFLQKNMNKTLNADHKGLKQANVTTPMFSKINNVSRSKFSDLSKTTTISTDNRTSLEKKLREKVVNESKSVSRNHLKNASFDNENNGSFLQSSMSKTSHSFAFNSQLINHLHSTLKANDDKREGMEDVSRNIEERINKLNQREKKDTLPYFVQLSEIYKSSFDDLLKQFPSIAEFKSLMTIIDGLQKFNEAVLCKCTKIQKKFEDLETNITNYNKLDEEFHSLKKLLLMKEEELEKIKFKLNSDKSSSHLPLNGREKSPRIEEYPPSNNEDSYINDEGAPPEIFDAKIKNLNTTNIDDLDAIYFPDKVKMRSNSACNNKVPRLDFNAVKLLNTNQKLNLNNYGFNNNNLGLGMNVKMHDSLKGEEGADPLKIRIIKNCNNTPVMSHHKAKNYVLPNSYKKVVINIESNQEKNNSKFK